MTEQMPVGMRFSLIHRFFKRQMDSRLKEYDLTGVQLGVLGVLDKLERSDASEVNQRDLENMSRVTHPTMTEIIKRLEKKGFISCCRSKTDGRFKCISSTAKSKQLHSEIQEMEGCVFKELCRGLTEEQVSQLLGFTDIMLSNAYDKRFEGSEGCFDKKACSERQGI